MSSDNRVAQDFKVAEPVVWSAVRFWRAGDAAALTALLMNLELGERLAVEVRLVHIVSGYLDVALGDAVDEYVTEALSNAHMHRDAS